MSYPRISVCLYVPNATHIFDGHIFRCHSDSFPFRLKFDYTEVFSHQTVISTILFDCCAARHKEVPCRQATVRAHAPSSLRLAFFDVHVFRCHSDSFPFGLISTQHDHKPFPFQTVFGSRRNEFIFSRFRFAPYAPFLFCAQPCRGSLNCAILPASYTCVRPVSQRIRKEATTEVIAPLPSDM